MDENERGYLLHECVAGETWDSLALDYYTDELLASEIIRANRELADILIFEGGELVAVPVLEEEAETPATAPPWRR